MPENGGATDANELEGLVSQQQRLQAELDAVTAQLASALAENPAEATPAATASLAAHRIAGLVEALADSPTESEAISQVISAARSLLPGTRGALSLARDDGSTVVVGVWDPSEQWNRPYRDGPKQNSPPQRLVTRVSSGPTGEAVTFPLRAFGLTLGALRVWAESEAAGLPPQELATTAVLLARTAALSLGGMALQHRLRSLSTHDPLTRLFNRSYLLETLERELHRARRVKGSLAVVLLDIDHFSLFNDHLGPEAGDRMLQALGGVLQASFRGSDVCARHSGERFVVVMPDSSVENARRRALELRAAIAEIRLPQAQDRGITVSVGVSGFPDHARTGDLLLAAADTALFAARQKGGDAVACATTVG